MGGFTGYESMTLIQGLKDVNLVAMDFVEVLPTIDPSGKTAYMCANLMHEAISVLALQKRDGKR